MSRYVTILNTWRNTMQSTIANEDFEAIICGIISLACTAKAKTAEQLKKCIEVGLLNPNAYAVNVNSLSEEDKGTIRTRVLDDFQFPPMPGTAIEDSSSQYPFNKNWLEEERSNITFSFSSRYFTYLERQKHWTRSTVDNLKHDSEAILCFLGNPKDKIEWHRKGLMIGDVQAGKTANYTAAICKAADAGFQIIILLAGTTENLRQQTQSRIDKEFVGITDAGQGKQAVGVSQMPNGAATRQIEVLTTVSNDFNNQATSNFLTKEGVLLLVVKKNAKILESVHDWFAISSNLLNNSNIDRSMLLIDDEADTASVNTNKPETDPTRINAQIRNLLKLFKRSSYLAVTATAFANIFIDPNLDNTMGKEDLFPSDYIYLLETPHQYVGADAMFGDIELADEESTTGKYAHNVISISNKEMGGKYEFKHKQDAVLKSIQDFSDLPESLHTALRYFILVQGIMDFNSGSGIHRSMMINVTRFVSLQNKLASIVNEWLREKVQAVVPLYASTPRQAYNAGTGEYYELRKIWEEFNLSEQAHMSWENYSTSYLASSIKQLHVVCINQSREARSYGPLVYDNEMPNRVIAIGGICLSRGLTLENLVVSYFYRNSKAYDTLLQMCRWFGYRGSIQGVFRVWLAEDAIDWYSLITDASNGLKYQIRQMNKRNETPKEFGFKVKAYPYTPLIITALGKMRNAKKGEIIPIDLRGNLIETPRLINDVRVNDSNNILIRNFINSLGKPATDSIERGQKDGVWTRVSPVVVADLIASFQCAETGLGFNVNELASYIKDTNNHMDDWTVVVVFKDGANKTTPNIPVQISLSDGSSLKGIAPFRTAEHAGAILKVGNHSVRIGAGTIAKKGLRKTQLEWYDKENGKKPTTSAPYLELYDNKPREPLLLIYPLKLQITNGKNILSEHWATKGDTITWGLGLGFPRIAQALKGDNKFTAFNYVLNEVKIQEARQAIMEQREEEDDQ